MNNVNFFRGAFIALTIMMTIVSGCQLKNVIKQRKEGKKYKYEMAIALMLMAIALIMICGLIGIIFVWLS